MREGAVAFLVKPVNEDELWDSINDAIKIEQRQHPQRKELAEIEARLAALTDDQRDVFRRILAGMPTSGLPTIWTSVCGPSNCGDLIS